MEIAASIDQIDGQLSHALHGLQAELAAQQGVEPLQPLGVTAQVVLGPLPVNEEVGRLGAPPFGLGRLA
ncbi:hypothetical protein D3C80_2210940 [compost metagenome]